MKIAPALVALTLLAAPAAALADCADAAGPGIEWRRCLMDGEDMSGVVLIGADLRSASFKRTNLAGADLTESRATGTKFISADMTGVQMDRAVMLRADFTSANLTGASFRNADLRRARFYDAKLWNADLTGARLEGADLLRTDFSGATWTDGATICAEGSIGRCIATSPAGEQVDDGS
ncbi:pentapeptide repeat-containing protein [Geminicoccus roseus]|uniref:pentapeptide repeat-containing protein n=1 Tax=Geminicoccus roseus TaxID=404900 RepID=UPI0004133CB5|nr:pentapeptide repeat-containing protein [Geminicoccus roseus]